MATALNPLIGYDAAAEIAKRSFKERRPVRELAREMTKLTRRRDRPRARSRGGRPSPAWTLGGGAGG